MISKTKLSFQFSLQCPCCAWYWFWSVRQTLANRGFHWSLLSPLADAIVANVLIGCLRPRYSLVIPSARISIGQRVKRLVWYCDHWPSRHNFCFHSQKLLLFQQTLFLQTLLLACFTQPFISSSFARLPPPFTRFL